MNGVAEIVNRNARAISLDRDDLVLIKRTKPLVHLITDEVDGGVGAQHVSPRA